jgi:hypothetical protein
MPMTAARRLSVSLASSLQTFAVSPWKAVANSTYLRLGT